MLHVQSLGKRKVYAISDAGDVSIEPPEGGGDEVAANALLAVRSMRSNPSLPGREAAAVSVKKAVIEMHTLLDVVSMLKNKDILTTQWCLRPLSSLPVGMTEKCSDQQAVALKAHSFSRGASLLTRAIAESSSSIGERRAYAVGCEQLRRRWQLSLQKPLGNAPAGQRQDVAKVNCSFSANGGKYFGDAWSETLSIGSNGPEVQKRNALQLQYTVEFSVQHNEFGTAATVTLWDLLNKAEGCCSDGSDKFQEHMSKIELLFQKMSHDSLCRELFDRLTAEVLRSAANGQTASDDGSSAGDGAALSPPAAASSLHALLEDDLTTALQIVHFSRMKISILLTDSSMLHFRLVEIKNREDGVPQTTPLPDLTDKLHTRFYDVLQASISASLLTAVVQAKRSWKDPKISAPDKKSARVSNVREKSDEVALNALLSIKKLTQFHITKFRLDEYLSDLKTKSEKTYDIQWVAEPDSLFLCERVLMLYVGDRVYEVTVGVNSLAVQCKYSSAPDANLIRSSGSDKYSIYLDGSDAANRFFSNVLM
jgi:hypothetical protein